MKTFQWITLVPMTLLFAQVEGELRTGQPVEQDLRGGGKHSYRILLKAGQYLQVGVEQQGIDVNLHLFNPSATELIDEDQYDTTNGMEALFILAEKSGEYRLEVRSDYPKAAVGRYRAEIVALREPSALDRVRISAAKALAEGGELRGRGTPDLLRKAGEKYKVALGLWEEAGDRERQAVVLLLLGATYNSLYDRKTALDYCERALSLRRQLGDESSEAQVLDFMGGVHYATGELGKALSYHQRALTLAEKLQDPVRLASALNNVGSVYNRLGEKQKAVGFYRLALPFYRAAGNAQQEAVLWNNLGLVYEGLGASQKSITALLTSIDLRRETKDRRGEARSLSNIAVTYAGMGDYERAVDYNKQALRIRREMEDVLDQAISLNNIGAIYDQLDPGKALEYHEAALPLAREAKDRQLEASTLSNIGRVHFEQRHAETALEYFQKAAEVWKSAGDPSGEAATLKNIAGVHLQAGNLKDSRNYASQAVSLSRARGSPQIQIATLNQLANVNREEGDLGNARARMEEALGLIETVRKSANSPALRSSFFAGVQPVLEQYIDLLMQSHKAEPSRGYDRLAFEVVERSRARSLMEVLGNASRGVRRGVEASLLEREAKLQQQIARMAAKGEKSSLDPRWIELSEVEERITAESTESAGAMTEPLRVAEIQEQLLDADTLLLEYALGTDRSFLWAVTPAKVTSFELPKRAEIENETGRLIDIVARHKGEAEYREVAASLSRKLLEPVRGQLTGKRLVLVVTGKLQYLPFGALPAPGEEVPLVVKNEIVMLPSASTLAALRKDQAGHAPAPRAVAILADPVYSATDARLHARPVAAASAAAFRSAEAGAEESDALDAARTAGVGELARLTFSREEAAGILALAPASQSFRALDFDASRATAMSERLGQYRILHFATHSFLNTELPELSGIVLSMVNRAGQPVDGFLRLQQIYSLKLPVDLVVLSACQTALGREIKGEGLVGLARGFMYAGAARVVASLWKVDDEATAELMKSFYKGMLGKQHLRAAAALRAAQTEMWRQPRWRDPYFWAAFTLQGEWK